MDAAIKPPFCQQVTFLNTSSLDASAEFYGRKIGLPLVYEVPGFVLVYRICADSFVGVCLRSAREPGDTKGVILAFVQPTTHEVDQWQKNLEAAGVKIEKPAGPGVSSDGKHVPTVYNLFVRDPAGYLVEVQAFVDTAWPSACPGQSDLQAPFSQQITFLNTSCLETSADFYGGKFGLPLVYEQPGFTRIYRVSADAFLGVCLRATRESGDAAGGIPTFVRQSTAEVDEWQTRLEAAGLSIEKAAGPGVSADGKSVPAIYNLFVRDPSGYLVEVQAFVDPAWPMPSGAAN